jgi:hypothetical protein
MLPRALLMALMMPLAAEEPAGPLALWAFGDGTRAGQACAVGEVVGAGETVAVGDRAVRLELLGLPGSDLILRPGSIASLGRDPARPDHLVVELHAGAIEVDLVHAPDSAEVEVRGAALGVHGHDCLLLIEREGAKGDYVAVVSGQAMAGIRPGISVDDGGMAILLQARQGLSCSASDGLAEVDQLDERPQLLAAGSLQEQGQEAGSDESWQRDDAAMATDDPAPDGSLTALPAVVAALPSPPSPSGPTLPVKTQPLPSAEPPRAPAAPLAQGREPPPPAPPAQAPVTSQGRVGKALIDALVDERHPGWQLRGRGASPFPSAN